MIRQGNDRFMPFVNTLYSLGQELEWITFEKRVYKAADMNFHTELNRTKPWFVNRIFFLFIHVYRFLFVCNVIIIWRISSFIRLIPLSTCHWDIEDKKRKKMLVLLLVLFFFLTFLHNWLCDQSLVKVKHVRLIKVSYLSY